MKQVDTYQITKTNTTNTSDNVQFIFFLLHINKTNLCAPKIIEGLEGLFVD